MRCTLAAALSFDLRLDRPLPLVRRAWPQTSPVPATPACATSELETGLQTARSWHPGHRTSTAPAAIRHCPCHRGNLRGAVAPPFGACSLEPVLDQESGGTSAPTAPQQWRVRWYNREE